MNSVGIDISKGRSTVAVMRPFGEVVISLFEVRHTGSELSELARQLKSLGGETRVVMEATGHYHASVEKLLHDAGLYVSVVNAKLVHDYGNNDLRRVKTDRKDAVKLANYACCTQTRNAIIGVHTAGISRCHGSVRRRPDARPAAHS